MISSLPLDVQGGIQGGLDGRCMNPLRLASLAPPYFPLREGEGIPLAPLRFAKGDSSLRSE